MKKQILLSLLALSIILTSCKKKAKEEDTDQSDPFKLEYSKLTTEQNKQEIEKAGIDLIKQMEDLPDQKFISGLQHLLELDLSLDFSLMNKISSLSTTSKEENIKGLFKGMASISAEPETKRLSEHYAIYTWNHNTKAWNESVSGNRIEIRFPSDSTKTVNNATLTFNYLPSSVKIDNAQDGKTELPSYISVVLKVDSKEELRLTSSYEYKADGTPTKTDMSLILGIYKFTQKIRNDGVSSSSEWSFIKETDVIMSMKLAAKGNTSLDTASSDKDVIENANASLEVMHIKLLGEVDIKGFIADSSSDNLTDTAAIYSKEAEKLNKYVRIVALNTASNTIIAKTDFVSVSENGSHSIEPRLIFKDDSKMSLDKFFESGFQALIDEIGKF